MFFEKLQKYVNIHQNRGLAAVGVLNSESVRKMRSKSCVKVEKGAWNVGFWTKLLLGVEMMI